MYKIYLFVLFACINLLSSDLSYTNKFYIDTMPKDKNFYIKFDNYSGVFSNLDQNIIKSLKNDGFILTNEDNTSTIIKLTINYFKQTPAPKTSGGYVNVGVGVGSRGYRQKEVKVGYVLGRIPDNAYFDTSLDNIYEAGTSLAIQIIDKKNQIKSYSTNLDYLSNYKDIKDATKDFENLISKEISKLLFIPISH